MPGGMIYFYFYAFMNHNKKPRGFKTEMPSSKEGSRMEHLLSSSQI
jgi:hypothetical protein